MMPEPVQFKKSGDDIYCPKYKQYVSGDTIILLDNIEQFEKDFKECFGDIPSKEDSENAIKFFSKMLYNIGYQNPSSSTSRSVSSILELIDESDVMKTFNRITELNK